MIVHAFRTVVADTGANVGYMIGSSGFQSGAIEAARMANVRLVTWEEFQEEFLGQWIEEHAIPSLWHRVNGLLRWTEPLPPSPGRPLTDSEKEAFIELWSSFQPLVSVLYPFMSYVRSMPNPPDPLSFPCRRLSSGWAGVFPLTSSKPVGSVSCSRVSLSTPTPDSLPSELQLTLMGIEMTRPQSLWRVVVPCARDEGTSIHASDRAAAALMSLTALVVPRGARISGRIAVASYARQGDP